MATSTSKPIDILLVEDSPSDAVLAIEALKAGKTASTLNHIEDGIEAMNYLRQRDKYMKAIRPDLIMLDLDLPGMDGREVLAEIKADDDLKIIPIIVLTTSSSDEDILKSYQLGANCFITKPVDFANFVNMVKSIKDFWLTVVTLPVK